MNEVSRLIEFLDSIGVDYDIERLEDCDCEQCSEPYIDRLDNQIGGDHYKGLAIQPVEYITANNIGYMEGNVIKYVTRWKDKNGKEDLRKAIHYLDLLIQLS